MSLGSDQPDANDLIVDTLPAALARHGIELPPQQVSRLDDYCRVLWQWNEKLNLTRHTDYAKFVARDVIDSLALAPFLGPDERMLDVGSGGGVPGVVLSILRPDLRVSLCESVGKKARALQGIVSELGLKLPVHAQRAEALLVDQRFESLVVRAVAPLAKLLTWFKPHWGAFDQLLVIKGPAWVGERGEARHYGLFNELQLRKVAEYPLAGTDSQSVVLQIRHKPTA